MGFFNENDKIHYLQLSFCHLNGIFSLKAIPTIALDWVIFQDTFWDSDKIEALAFPNSDWIICLTNFFEPSYILI